ncbi:MAG: hypothetical protein KF864_07235 [Phycisphaeraceae bacterium]|nr:hypothetical protein [Phycisphaeraceae bacterium]
MIHTRSLSLTLAVIFAVGGVAGLANAQQNRPANPQRQQPPREGELRGPRVNDNAPPGENRRFTSGGGGQRRDQAGAEIPHPVYVRAYEVLRSDKTEASLRLTPDQDKRLAAALDGYRDEVRAFREANKAEIDEIRASAPPEMRRRIDAMLNAGEPVRPGQPRQPDGQRPAGRPDQAARPGQDRPQRRGQDGAPPRGRPNADGPDQMNDRRPPMDEADAQALRDRVRQLAEKAPKPAETHAKMWAVLTDAQKPVVQKELDRLREQTAQRRDGQGMTPPARGGAPEFDESRLPEQMRERLRNMDPEQRRQAIERIRRQQQERQQRPE